MPQQLVESRVGSGRLRNFGDDTAVVIFDTEADDAPGADGKRLWCE
ncbi:MAG: hypothetical protein CLLPBCKN_006529 [Chroococcidiopsis cubana SAG 39.79]|nr:hypothetical protein [Chroococcidiopsis cubana]MDZ4877094.1 hypothetical protein [Chroococcidiopsis cubana SAG 39.79]